jgi:hypothetical protein
MERVKTFQPHKNCSIFGMRGLTLFSPKEMVALFGMEVFNPFQPPKF